MKCCRWSSSQPQWFSLKAWSKTQFGAKKTFPSLRIFRRGSLFINSLRYVNQAFSRIFSHMYVDFLRFGAKKNQNIRQIVRSSNSETGMIGDQKISLLHVYFLSNSFAVENEKSTTNLLILIGCDHLSTNASSRQNR